MKGKWPLIYAVSSQRFCLSPFLPTAMSSFSIERLLSSTGPPRSRSEAFFMSISPNKFFEKSHSLFNPNEFRKIMSIFWPNPFRGNPFPCKENTSLIELWILNFEDNERKLCKGVKYGNKSWAIKMWERFFIRAVILVDLNNFEGGFLGLSIDLIFEFVAGGL